MCLCLGMKAMLCMWPIGEFSLEFRGEPRVRTSFRPMVSQRVEGGGGYMSLPELSHENKISFSLRVCPDPGTSRALTDRQHGIPEIR